MPLHNNSKGNLSEQGIFKIFRKTSYKWKEFCPFTLVALGTPWLEEKNREGGWQGEDPVVLLFLSSLLERASSPSLQRDAFGGVFLLMLKKNLPACTPITWRLPKRWMFSSSGELWELGEGLRWWGLVNGLGRRVWVRENKSIQVG